MNPIEFMFILISCLYLRDLEVMHTISIVKLKVHSVCSESLGSSFSPFEKKKKSNVSNLA